jgi:two-component system LytT family sensor kinase
MAIFIEETAQQIKIGSRLRKTAMPPRIPDYLLVSELLGFGTGTVLSILLVLLVRRSPQRSRGTPLLAFSALLWNVVGLLTVLLMLSGMGIQSLPVSLARATFLSGGAIFPISFLMLWSRPLPQGSWQEKVSRWLYRIAIVNAVVIVLLLFACPLMKGRYIRMVMYTVPLNAAIIMTVGAFTQVRGWLRAASDRIYLTLTLIGIWGATVAMVLLDQAHFPPRVEAFLVIAKEQSPFLAVLGALFFFARFRSSDVLIKQSLRVIAATGIGLWTCLFLAESLPDVANRLSAYPTAARTGLAAAMIAALLLLFALVDKAIRLAVDYWILRQPDYRATLRRLWDGMAVAESEIEVFAVVDRVVCEALDIAAARVLKRGQIAGIESHAASNAGQLWELCCDDPCRRAVAGCEVDVLVPVRFHGSITHVIAVAPGPGRRSLLNSDLRFLENVAGQTGSRLEAMAHERERIERQSREATLRQLAAQAELKALRAQINPHFLFNSLNTVADLIVTDPVKAETMTVLLAKVFRHVLQNSDRQLTRVAEEMDFLRTYLRIEEVRFGDRLRVRMDVDPAVSRDSIPSLILQPVVENAIKHGLAPKVGDGNLSILADRQGEFLRLSVEDDGVGPDAPAGDDVNRKNNGVGLKIIAERLRTLYDGRASLSIEKAAVSGSRVTILIPRSEALVGSP